MRAWQSVALGDIAQLVDYGVTASATQEPVGPKFLRISDIQNGNVDWASVPWCECDDRSAVSARLKTGDIVFARTGATTGKSFLIRECPSDAVFASYLIRVRLDATIADPDFIAHYFQSKEYWSQIARGARGVAQPGMNATILKSLTVPIPPIPEQRQIAAILDIAEALRAKRRAAFMHLSGLAHAMFTDMFGDSATNPRGWDVSPIGEVMQEVYRYPTYYNISYVHDGVPEVRGELLMDDGQIDSDRQKLRFISPSTAEKFPRTTLFAGDLVMSVRGTVGKVGLVPQELAGANITANLIRMSPNRLLLDPTFIWHVTQTHYFKRMLSGLDPVRWTV